MYALLGVSTCSLQAAAPRQRREGLAGHNDVVEHGNADLTARCAQLPRHLKILGRWFGIPGGMIVDKNQRSRTQYDGIAKNLAGMDQRRVQDAPRDLALADRGVLGVEEEDVELLMGEVGERGREDVVHVGRPRDGVFPDGARGAHPSAKLDRRHEPGGHGRSDPGNGFQAAEIHPREFPQTPAREVEDALGQVAGRCPSATRADEQRQQLLLGQGAGAKALEPLARSRLGRLRG